MTRLRQLWLLTALGSLAALMGGYFLMVSPQKSEAASVRTETEGREAQNAQLQGQINQLNAQKKKLPEQQALLSRFTGLIPNNPALPRLIRSLSDAADNAGVELVTISPKLPEWSKGFSPATRLEVAGRVDAPGGQVLVTIPVELRVTGEYSQVNLFFTELEEMNRALMVTGFQIKRLAEAPRKVEGVEASAETYDELGATIQTQIYMTKKAPPAPAPAKTTTSSDNELK